MDTTDSSVIGTRTGPPETTWRPVAVSPVAHVQRWRPTLIAALVAVALLIHSGVMLLQGRPEAIKVKWVAQLLGLTSFGMVAFVFSLSIGDWSRGLSVGWSTFVGIGGLIGASAVMATLVRPLLTTNR